MIIPITLGAGALRFNAQSRRREPEQELARSKSEEVISQKRSFLRQTRPAGITHGKNSKSKIDTFIYCFSVVFSIDNLCNY
jgi:hypothetical protein